jgi:hypothetical protein
MATANMRVSNEERNRAITTLDVHLATGRLELAEYGERCGRATVAKTRGELEELFADLPAPHPDLSSASPPGQLIQKAGQLVSPPTRGKKKQELVATPASTALEMVAGIAFVFGIPMAILLTIFLGQWWTFIPIVLVVMVAGGTSDAMKKPNPDN